MVRKLGQYPTPVWVAEALVERHFSKLDARDFVIEPSCGPGAFLSAIPTEDGYVFITATLLRQLPLMLE